MDTKFNVIVADPPWPSGKAPTFFGQRSDGSQGGEPQYSLMSASEIKAFELPPTTETAVLFLWRLASLQELALEVCRAWKFRPQNEMIWRKLTSTGKPWMGMGLYVRSAHETCLIGVKKMVQPLRKNVRTVFDAQYTGRHSGKPEEFFDIVESMFPGPYCELFARRQRPGWTCLGDEVNGNL